jgi:hypothetical protein
MRPGRLLVVLALAALPAWAEETNSATAIIEKMLARRPDRDLSLRARLTVDRNPPVPVEVLMQHRPDETRTIYRGAGKELLVVQPLAAAPRFYLKGTGELVGDQRLERWLGSHFTCYDLGLPFLRWPKRKLAGEDLLRGRDCWLIECAASNQPYASVKLWIDQEYCALLRAEARNADGDVVRRFMITSFKKVGAVWIPRGLDAAFVPPGQALPAQERSRLEIYEGNYDAKLPADWFEPAK